MKKILIFVLAFACLLGLALSFGAAQTATVTITPNKSSAYAGDSVIFTVKVTGVSAAKSIGIIPSYDSAVFELVSGEWLVSGSAMSDFSGGTATIAYAASRGFNENVFRFTLKLKSNAKLGNASVNANVNIKNGNETVNCNVSAGKVTVSCKHSYSGWSNANGTSHTRTCSVCKNTETKNHAFTNACDTSCNDCSFTRVTNHTYESKWTADASQHWYACSGCGEKKDAAAHTPGPAATENSDQICTVCNHVLQSAQGHTHTPSQVYSSDEAGHWLICEGCKEPLEKAEHVFSAVCDDTCDTCQYKRTVTHTYGTEWRGDETAHWHVCTVCNGLEEGVAHVWGEGTVTSEPSENAPGTREHTCSVCQRKKTVELILQTIPAEPSEANEASSFSVVALLIGLGVGLAVGLGGGFAISAAKGKKTAK